MKISEIINELTELKKLIGDKDLEACIANDTTAGVNVIYHNDEGGWTSTSLVGEKIARQMKESMSNEDGIDKIKDNVL